MKIAIVSEGESEFYSFCKLYDQLQSVTGNQFLKPLKVNVDPQAPAKVIARAVSKIDPIVVRKLGGDGFAVVVLDLEKNSVRPGSRSRQVQTAIDALGLEATYVVVHKVTTFENWLISDVDAVAGLAEFNVGAGARREVEPDKADKVPAIDWLRKVAVKGYHKTKHSSRIADRADVATMCRNSRSFRRFMRVIGDPSYASQSARPAQPR